MKSLLYALALTLPVISVAQNTADHQHSADMNHDTVSQQSTMNTPLQGGQSAFAAIQEIVDILTNDPATIWGRADIEALRSHLIDMDNVTLRAQVQAEDLANGALFSATSQNSAVAASIQNMVLAHAATMDGVNGWTLTATQLDTGATLLVESPEADADKIQALGFIGLMTVGMHHQAHHIAIASGDKLHGH